MNEQEHPRPESHTHEGIIIGSLYQYYQYKENTTNGIYPSYIYTLAVKKCNQYMSKIKVMEIWEYIENTVVEYRPSEIRKYYRLVE